MQGAAAMDHPKVSRFDLSETVREFVNLAVSVRVIDAADVLALGLSGLCESEVVHEVLDASHANRHTPSGREAHAQLCELGNRVLARAAGR